MERTERAGAKEWLGLAVLALPTLLLSVDATVLYLALPHLGADLRPSGAETLWIIDVYGFMIAGFLITMGTLGDRIGRRKLLMIGALAFGVASVAAAYATDPALLIGARALLGIAGATLMPSTLALITTMFHDPGQRGAAIGVWAACFSAGVAAGPLVGGALLELFWWGSVFLLAVPVMVLLLVAAPILLPESRDPEPGRLDLVSVLLSLAAILPVIYGLKVVASDGVEAGAVAAVVVGLVIAVVFVRRQRSLPDPLLDVRLFARPAFLGALLALLVGLAVVGVVYMFVTQYLQMVAGHSPLAAGLWLLPSAVAMIVASMAAPALARRVPAGRLVAAALVVSAAGYLLLAFVDGPGGLALAVTGLVVVYLGIGPMMALGTELVVGAAPPARAGSAAAMSETSMELGLALGVAVLGSVGTAVYRSELPEGTPADAVESLAGALAVGGADVVEAARSAFTSGLNVVGLVSAVATVAIAVVTAVLVRPSSTSGQEPVAEKSNA
ncbi:MFS transporter [Saccharothrix texasensis]|uniref:DHA2 family multidrug resistance protein-like MFS transporter n=1 Tax=Saccharothrix texasensis TaxID=103734 RepID=A0A3N1GZM6_9PSEU|nr:MFS transporter [Saccharothrix texasensis]ROP35659.1 DHA2 family multidrug resistance protein-like MFS transporter [Saccharothrix texasensis]